ncbi:AbrB/MazE/SpoVT family DNA-binding domain-containing protein [Natrinema caseinilyticum]|uniref:AbrB/MazE/SpoVT family DNA-binding domain-containing protein n=1 Tax=Natrinema caseinilyticum TaxID=2961570 RepID=UPI0020C454F5|nr:AbrB/MazE/SpoVT family DNA-binding domain-containing protein [Natrinema caseinilyticum]
MSSSTNKPRVVRVSQKGQATIPKALREKFGIETPGEVFVYEEDERIVIEPVPSPDELHGIHAGEHEPGSVTRRVRELREADHHREDGSLDRLRPASDE